jgi:hypothetical protein
LVSLNPKYYPADHDCNPETISALQAFRKRHSDAVRVQHAQSSQPTTVDFVHYRSVLKNTAIVDEAEKLLKTFKPVSYDVNAHVKAIETFEAKAVGALVLSIFSSRRRVPFLSRLTRLRRRRTRSTLN